MRNLNVEIEDATYEAAKASAGRAGMLLRKWVERAILDAADLPDNPAVPGAKPVRLREPVNVPLEDA